MSSPLDDSDFGLVMLGLFAWAVAWLIAWAVFWRRRGARWPLWVALVPLAPCALIVLLALGPIYRMSLPVSILGMIGLGKLIIWLIGRRSVLANSKLRYADAEAAPHGIVRESSYED